MLALLTEQLTDDGIVSVRTESFIKLLDNYKELECIDRRVWGGMAVTLLRLKSEPAGEADDE